MIGPTQIYSFIKNGCGIGISTITARNRTLTVHHAIHCAAIGIYDPLFVPNRIVTSPIRCAFLDLSRSAHVQIPGRPYTAATVARMATRNTSPGHFQCCVIINVHAAAIHGITAGDGAGALRAAVLYGQGRTATHLEHAAVAGHPQCTAVQVEGQVFCYLQRGSDLRIGVQGNGRVVRRSVDFCLQVRQRRPSGGHQGICYIPRCNKSCPYGQRAYQYQGHQDGEQSSLHGGSSFYGSHISLPGLCAAKFLVGKVLRRAGSVVRPSYQKVSRKATGIPRCWHKKSVWEV